MTRRRATFAPPEPTEKIALEGLPVLSPATADLVCWLWAATPPKDGRLDVARAATSLGVSNSTLRRWIKHAKGTEMPAPARAKRTRMHQLAILRGRGQLLWPPLSRTSHERQLALTAEAKRSLDFTRAEPEHAPKNWLAPHTLYLVHYPRARCYGVASGSTKATPNKIRAADGTVVAQTSVANRHAAALAKAAILEQVREGRCIPPRELVPTGRTETWLQGYGAIDLNDVIDDDLR